MAILIIYEAQYAFTGWIDDDGGYRAASWFDRDLTSDTPLPLAQILPPMFEDDDVFYTLPPITVVVFPSLFLDADLFFIPMSLRILTAPDQMLKNEVRRIR